MPCFPPECCMPWFPPECCMPTNMSSPDAGIQLSVTYFACLRQGSFPVPLGAHANLDYSKAHTLSGSVVSSHRKPSAGFGNVSLCYAMSYLAATSTPPAHLAAKRSTSRYPRNARARSARGCAALTDTLMNSPKFLRLLAGKPSMNLPKC